jgi:hypothetical protein
VFENKLPRRGNNGEKGVNHIIMSVVSSYSYVYGNWVKADVIGEVYSIQDKSENCIKDFSWKSRKTETTWKVYG